MSLKILIDMNLSPDWVAPLVEAGWSASHWSLVGAPTAPDEVLAQWAVANGYVVFTMDLDFSRLLALSNAGGPSIVQLRGQNVLPDHAGYMIINTIQRFEAELERGAIVVVDERSARVRVLPLK